MGAITRTAGGEVAGAVMDRMEQSMLDATLLEGKLGAQSKMRDLVAKYADGAGRGVQKLGPVMSYLANSFPSGEPDPEKDPRKQAANRINEVQRAASIAPDALFSALEPMLGHPGDVAWKIHNMVVAGLLHLVQAAPKDSGTDVKMFQSGWTPSWTETVEFAHRLEAFMNPLSAIARVMSGEDHPAAAETLWKVWPATMNEMANGVAETASTSNRLGGMSYERTRGLSQLFSTPMSPLQDPGVVLSLQGMYMPTMAGSSAGGGNRGPAKPARPVGRPAAVQSPVAGTSVANLISQ